MAKEKPSTSHLSCHNSPGRLCPTVTGENSSLAEIITVYEKLTKSRDQDVGCPRADIFRPTDLDFHERGFEESRYFRPNFKITNSYETVVIPMDTSMEKPTKVLDFSKYCKIENMKCQYISALTGLIQGKEVNELNFGSNHENFDSSQKEMDYVNLLQSEKYWLDIMDPSEDDFALLNAAFKVHDLTLRDIRERNTEEKLEVFKHYVFISMKLLSEDIKMAPAEDIQKTKSNLRTDESICVDLDPSSSCALANPFKTKAHFKPDEDMDFNILLFSDFIITVHDKNWSPIKDVFGFLNLLTTCGNTVLSPEWVLFSFFIELLQDAKDSLNHVEPHILKLKLADTATSNTHYTFPPGLEQSLNKCVEYNLELYKTSKFIKPKTKILKALEIKCCKTIDELVLKRLSNIRTELDELLDDVDQLSQVLERSQDMFLTLTNIHNSVEGNRMGKLMQKMSEIAIIFLPVHAIGGFLGMNLTVPFQTGDGNSSTLPFWCIVLGSCILAACLFFWKKLTIRRQG